MIKDLVVNISQSPIKRIMMDVVVENVLVNYVILLSRSRGSKLGGTLQMDMKYSTVPTFGRETRRIYRENKLSYTFSYPKNPNNYPM